MARKRAKRLKKDMKDGKVVLGSFMTHKANNLSTAYLDSIFLKNALVLGVDFEYALPDRSLILSCFAASSSN